MGMMTIKMMARIESREAGGEDCAGMKNYRKG
jgi:hypothetical protein